MQKTQFNQFYQRVLRVLSLVVIILFSLNIANAMNPAKAKVLICPHCGGEKEVLKLLSGNTIGAVLWSDNKQIAPMLPRVSFVQHCPKCGHYYLLTMVKEEKVGEKYSFDTGELSWKEMKGALIESKDWELDESEELNFLFHALWAYNDEFYRKEKASVPTAQDESLKRQVVEKLLTLISDKILCAELNRQIGNFDEALSLIEEAKPTDLFILGIATKTSSLAINKDTKPFIISE